MTIDTIYFIHHSHTDIGFTHDQPILLDLEERFISEAVRLAGKYADSDTDGAFRWTVETTYVLKQWLDHAPPAEVDSFIALEKAGRIEVTGMFANLTPLFDTDELIESMQLLRTLREDYGFTIRNGMNCDVNGQNWPLVERAAGCRHRRLQHGHQHPLRRLSVRAAQCFLVARAQRA